LDGQGRSPLVLREISQQQSVQQADVQVTFHNRAKMSIAIIAIFEF
jgi:hypothetical protein